MQNQKHNVLDTSHVGRLLMKLTTPLFFGMLIQSMYSIVDTIFIGRYVGSLGIAGLSIDSNLIMLSQGITMMIGVGGGTLISRLIGESDHRRAERALGNSITFSIIFSVLLMLLVLPGINFWLKLLGASEDVLPFARDYLVITMAGIGFSITSNMLLSLVRAEGNARVCMISLIMQSVLNIILDAVFVIALGMGVKGAALATIISQMVALLYVLSYYLTGESYLKIRLSNFMPDFKVVKSIFAVGISQFCQNIANSASLMFLVRTAVTYGGDIALSAFGISNRILFLGMMPTSVISQAMQPILGFNYGARRYHLLLKTIKTAALIATAFNLVAFLVLFFFPGPFIKIFTSDPQLIAEGSFVAKRMALVFPFFIFNIGAMVFPATGKAVQTFIVTVTRPIFFLTPLVLILPRFFQENGLWLSFPGADFLALVLTTGFLIPLIRKFRKAAAAGTEKLPALTPE